MEQAPDIQAALEKEIGRLVFELATAKAILKTYEEREKPVPPQQVVGGEPV